MWHVATSDEFDVWFATLDETAQVEVIASDQKRLVVDAFAPPRDFARS